MLTVYCSEMSVLCECEIVLVWSDWRRSVWGVGVKLKYEVLVWSLEHVKGWDMWEGKRKEWKDVCSVVKEESLCQLVPVSD